MNKPDDTMIQNWLKGELEGEELRQMESWAEEHAEQLEAEMGWDTLHSEISSNIPKEEEPPYADFFNERVKHHTIEEPEERIAEPKKSQGWIQRLNWLLAPTALAGMMVCFYLGTKIDSEQSTAGSSVAQLESVYTPVSGVTSAVSDSGDATVIVLDGLEDIPDTLNIAFGETSYGVSPRMLASVDRNNFF